MSSIIKVFAIIFIFLGILICGFGGLFVIGENTGIGLALWLGGIPGVLLSSAILYGFGEIMDNTQKTVETNEQLIKIGKALLLESIATDDQNNISRESRLKFWKASGIISDETYKLEMEKLQQQEQPNPEADSKDLFA